MKTQEELKTIKEEFEALNNKLKELTEDELNMVTGGLRQPGLLGTVFSINNLKSFVDSEDKNIVGEIPDIPDREKYVM